MKIRNCYLWKPFFAVFFLFGLSACDGGFFKTKQTREEAYSGKSFEGKSGAEIDWNDYGWFNPGFLDYFFPNLDRWLFDEKPGAKLWKKASLPTTVFINRTFEPDEEMDSALGFSHLGWFKTGPTIEIRMAAAPEDERIADIRVYMVEQPEGNDWIFTQDFPSPSNLEGSFPSEQKNSDTYNWQKRLLGSYKAKVSNKPDGKCLLFNDGEKYLIYKTIAIIVVSKEEIETGEFTEATVSCSYKTILFHMGAIYIESAPSHELVYRRNSPNIPSLQNKISANSQLMATYYFLVSKPYMAGDPREDILLRARAFWEGYIKREWQKYQETK